jgi:hypothetical protein
VSGVARPGRWLSGHGSFPPGTSFAADAEDPSSDPVVVRMPPRPTPIVMMSAGSPAVLVPVAIRLGRSFRVRAAATG